ncbi:mitochondrial protein [Pluteus cervinus]|uniref:Mitochondrial protein n=1 Tax=Pluteus cervinus TaxID=181527 RepID=A0ACD3BFD8_9AGAR|nr:mitochondrial protein [Pluteus cervinus]
MGGALRRVLVVGGNGFIGSAICRAALARGMEVVSVSSSGRPYRTPKGHTPSWTSKVDWQQGDAFNPSSFAHLFPQVSGVVHTLGTLLEGSGEYKKAVREGNILGLLGSFTQVVRRIKGGPGGNPLEKPADGGWKGSYEALNRDAALRVCEAFLGSPSPAQRSDASRPFVFISAEDIFRPIIPSRYIETKREAEGGIDGMVKERTGFHAVHIRPSLVYHAHLRPLTTPPAVVMDLFATLHGKIPPGIPTPSSLLRLVGMFRGGSTSSAITPSVLNSVANALTTRPIHVDHVAQAVCVALERGEAVQGVVDVRRMRELLEW